MSNQETIFSEKDGDTFYSITKGVFYIKDFMADMLAYRVIKHTQYSKPIVEYTFVKTQAEAIMKDLMKA